MGCDGRAAKPITGAADSDMLSVVAGYRLPFVPVVKNRPLRIVLMALGWLWVGVAFVGVFLPGLPTTGPILLAAFFFSKSSERFDDWLVNNRFFGVIVRDWRAGRGFTIKAKVIALVAIAISFGFTTWFFLTDGYIRAILWATAAGVAVFIVTRPTKKTVELVETSIA